ncbi:MAG: histidinol dehydrogenase [Steroidobacterales bacterium]
MQRARLHDLRAAPAIPPDLLARTEADLGAFTAAVGPIIEAVRVEGDAALLRFARQFDHVTLERMPLRVADVEFDAAFGALPADVVRAIEHAINNIRRFHELQKPNDLWLREIEPGIWGGERHTPIDSVACYVPRGKGSFPSVVNMTVLPGVVAGVPRLVIVTPPGPDGTVDAGTLVAAKLAGVTEIYKCGGAQAVAAVAYGTETVPKCLKIVGPGSPWVVAAKRLLSETIDPGVPAGPSESIILADETTNPALAALDLIIESEHGPDSSAFLVTPCPRVADGAIVALQRYWQDMEPGRAQFSRTVLCGAHGGIVLTRDFDAAVEFTNAYAPEHLQILAAEPGAVLGRIRNAGEILLGPYTPCTLANYLLGPNAVLPTGGRAKTASPLSVFDYMKRTSVAQVTRSGYERVAADAHRFALYEGFDGHARAVSSVRTGLLPR